MSALDPSVGAVEPSIGRADAATAFTVREVAPHSSTGTSTDAEAQRVTTGIARQIAIVVAGFIAYGAVRALTDAAQTTAFDNASSILTFESRIGIDIEAGLQQFVLEHGYLTTFFNLVYVWMYWPTLVGTLALTWFRRRRLFYVLRDALLYSGAIGLAIFALYPVAPPRFLDGFVDTVDETQRSHFIAHPSFLINKFAALPSFHIGWVALACTVLILATRRRWLRALTTMAPALMGIAVIVTGNHYVVDVVAGLAICFAALAISIHRSNARHPQRLGSAEARKRTLDPGHLVSAR